MRQENRSGRPAWIGLLALSMVLFGSNISNAASLRVDSRAGGTFFVFDGNNIELDVIDGDARNPAFFPDDSVAALAVTEFNFASAQGSAGFGWLRSSANATSQVGRNSQVDTSSNTSAQWRDVLTFVPSDPALLNTAGSFRSRMTTGGALQTQTGFLGNAIASVGISANFGSGATAQGFSKSQTSATVAGITKNTGDISLLLDVEVAFIWGQQLSFDAELRANANAFGSEGNVGSGGEAFANFLNTSEWGGITGVRQADGSVVTDFQLISSSGANYLNAIAAPVPEPSTAVLLGFALALATVARRLHRSATNAATSP